MNATIKVITNLGLFCAMTHPNTSGSLSDNMLPGRDILILVTPGSVGARMSLTRAVLSYTCSLPRCSVLQTVVWDLYIKRLAFQPVSLSRLFLRDILSLEYSDSPQGESSFPLHFQSIGPLGRCFL